MGSTAGRERGRLEPLGPEEAARISHELADEPSARFFRLRAPLPEPDGQQDPAATLREGDTLVVLGSAGPNEGDLVAVRLEGNGYLLGRSRRQGTWCLLAGGAAVPMDPGGSLELTGVVVGVIRKVPAQGGG